MKRTSHSYYAVFINYGRRGIEAIVDPELTRRAVIERIRSGEYSNIEFIHHVDGLFVEDVTDELKGEASFANACAAIADALEATPQANAFDHARKLRVEA